MVIASFYILKYLPDSHISISNVIFIDLNVCSSYINRILCVWLVIMRKNFGYNNSFFKFFSSFFFNKKLQQNKWSYTNIESFVPLNITCKIHQHLNLRHFIIIYCNWAQENKIFGVWTVCVLHTSTLSLERHSDPLNYSLREVIVFDL